DTGAFVNVFIVPLARSTSRKRETEERRRRDGGETQGSNVFDLYAWFPADSTGPPPGQDDPRQTRPEPQDQALMGGGV
ncbi:unnamed protein product, partial [Boreogadus saida]